MTFRIRSSREDSMKLFTTFLEAVCAVALIAGVFVLAGLGWALVTLGVGGFLFSWWVNR